MSAIEHKKNTAYYLAIPMIDSTTPASYKTGLSPTDTAYYKDGAGAWTSLAITDTFAEIGSTGVYEIDLTASEMNHDQVLIKLTASGACDDMVLFDMRAFEEIADTVWDELASEHTTPSTFGKKLDITGQVASETDLATVDTVVDAIKVKTDFLPSATAGAAGGVFIAGTNAATTITTALTTTFTGNVTGTVGGVAGTITTLDALNTANQVDLDAILLDTGTTIPAQITALNNISAADVWAAAAAIEGTYTPTEALNLILAACSGKISGAATTTVTVRDVTDTRNAIIATVDSDGNRTALTLDPS